MDRSLQCGNRVCTKRAEHRRLEMHRTRLRNVRPLVDTSEPKAVQFDHVRLNLKKEQMLEERYMEIDRENRILLKKMSDIAKQSPPKHCASACARVPGPNSLNRDARKRELLQITSDNQAILKRIQQAQPVYNHVEMQGECRKQQTYLRNCTEFPLVLRSARGRPSELVPLHAATSPEDQAARPQSARSSQAGETMQVFQEGRRINEIYYIVEMVTDGRCLHIQATMPEAHDGEQEQQETLQLTLKEKTHRRLHRELNGDYSLIANCLALQNGELHIIIPEVAGRASRGGTPRVRAPSLAGSPKADELGAEEMMRRGSSSGDRR